MQRTGVLLVLAAAMLAGCGDGEGPTAPGTDYQWTAMDGSGAVAMEMVWIEPGTFLMGSPASEPGREADEGPQHEVVISRGFWLGKYEVTQAQWRSAITPPAGTLHQIREIPDCPVSYVSWRDVQTFIEQLNQAEGAQVYRLPTEAEWEYACRAGTTARWSHGDDENRLGDYAWYWLNAWNAEEKYIHGRGMKKPNPWGLYDMYGNVFEWVQDWYAENYYRNSPGVDPRGPETGTLRVARGGHMASFARQVRSACRARADLTLRSQFLGVRLVRQRP
jgi:formylglycine-generating enzyme required for sulfatase activity